MHPDIRKLINIATEGGEFSEKQKEIILRKAEKLGEDVDEVEMMLKIMNQSHPNQAKRTDDKKMRCPGCGAVISETTFACPECGYVLQQENSASIEARKTIELYERKLRDASEKAPSSFMELLDTQAPEKRMAQVINSFTMPTTKEGLTQLLEFSYSNYMSSVGIIRKAWYGKTLQAYHMLDRIGNGEQGVQALLDNYSVLLNSEKKKIRLGRNGIILLVCGSLVLLLMALCFYLGN